MSDYIVPFTECGMEDVARVGGKNASLGEMIRELSRLGIRVPDGFATTAAAYREFLATGGLDKRIRAELDSLDVDDVVELAKRGRAVREAIMSTPLPKSLEEAVTEAWRQVAPSPDTAFAVRSSATAEDLPEASFAGQQETLLNVVGIDAIIRGIHEVFASLFNDRAISYRVHHGFAHEDVALSAGIQRMVRSDIGSAGVMFTLDTESGFRDLVLITSAYGLGESVVQGSVNPDEFYLYKPALGSGKVAIVRKNLGSKATRIVYSSDPEKRVEVVDVDPRDRAKFSLSDADATALAKQGVIIEKHYGRPMDIEWAKDGETGELFILQARPETVQSRVAAGRVRFRLEERGPVLAQGRSIGQRIGRGKAKIVEDPGSIHLIEDGDVLVTDMTDPDWEPVMKRCAAIVTNRGGRTCHAAIVARELGIPAVVGCGNATETVPHGRVVTVSCAEGDEGYVYDGALDYEEQTIETGTMPEIPVKIMMNVGNPDRAFAFASIPNHGVGLARLEFIINRMIGVHPLALIEYDAQEADVRARIDEMAAGYADPVTFFVEKLAEGIGSIAAAFAPEPVIVRLSDFKSNEYANLIGGKRYEPAEENPMLGFRGASRYLDASFEPCFELECRALKRVREEMGLGNVAVMVPFVRTVEEGRRVVELLAENGLVRARDGLRIIMMCEIPSNALLADAFLDHFDGMSIGSNDMTQLALGVDRDSGRVAALFDERDEAVKKLLAMAIEACTRRGKYVGICGQGPSDHPDFAQWLLEQGIESISLNPDSVVDTWLYLGEHLPKR